MALHFVEGYEPSAGAPIDPFAAVWEHYLATGFVYHDKLSRLESALPSIHASWPLLLAAPATLFQVHAAWVNDQIRSSIAAFRDTQGTYVVQHAASKDPQLMLRCIQSCLTAINADPEFQYARMYFRLKKDWPTSAAQAIARALGPYRASLYERAYLVCIPDALSAIQPVQHVTDQALSLARDLRIEDYPMATALLIETIGSHRAGALGFILNGTADLPLHDLNIHYLATGLRRTRRLLAAYTGDTLVGLALCHTASAVMNFSYLCSRTELVIHPRAPNRAQIVTRLAEAAIAEARARGEPCTTLLIDGADAPAACEAGYVDTQRPYAELTWARENDRGAQSATRAVEGVYEETLRRLQRRKPNASGGVELDDSNADSSAPSPSMMADVSML